MRIIDCDEETSLHYWGADSDEKKVMGKKVSSHIMLEKQFHENVQPDDR